MDHPVVLDTRPIATDSVAHRVECAQDSDASDKAKRLRLLLRAFGPPRLERVLELASPRETAFAETAGTAGLAAGERSTRISCLRVADARGVIRFADRSFEMVVMHGMDAPSPDSSPAVSIARTLAEAARVLVPGGIVIGFADNRGGSGQTASDVATGTQPSDANATAPSCTGPTRVSPDACRIALRQAGFCEVELYAILPSRSALKTLICLEEPLSRSALRNFVRESRGYFRPVTHPIRRILANFGMRRYLVGDFLFVGRKSC